MKYNLPMMHLLHTCYVSNLKLALRVKIAGQTVNFADSWRISILIDLAPVDHIDRNNVPIVKVKTSGNLNYNIRQLHRGRHIK